MLADTDARTLSLVVCLSPEQNKIIKQRKLTGFAPPPIMKKTDLSLQSTIKEFDEDF